MYTADIQLLSISETYFEFEGVLFVVIFVVMKAAKTNYKLYTLYRRKENHYKCYLVFRNKALCLRLMWYEASSSKITRLNAMRW